MASTRRKRAAIAWLGPVFKTVLLCLFFGGAGVGYVAQQKQILELGQEKGRKESRLLRLRQQNRALQDAVAALSSPRALDARVRELRLGLVPPAPGQVIHLEEPPTLLVGELTGGSAARLAGQQLTGPSGSSSSAIAHPSPLAAR
jgi:hypothetical protein